MPAHAQSTGPSSTGGASNGFPWLSDLNEEQIRAATHGDGPLLVVAGAGSGKTRTLAYRVAYLIASGIDPSRLLLLTFTRRAAEEMLRRASNIIGTGVGVAGKVWGGTFHATANRLIRIYATAAGLDPDFTVMDRSDSEDLLNMLRHELGLDSRGKRFPRKQTCMAIYSRSVNASEKLDHVLKTQFPWCKDCRDGLSSLFRAYVEAKQERNVLDYDDLLLYWAHLLGDQTIAKDMGNRFDHVLVDEYQDTNRVQSRILRGMRRWNQNIMAVGDDAQSIYSFRAATIRNMLDFPRHFPGTRILTLERNYRSVAPILHATNRLISHAKERFAKELWSARGEGERPRLVTCRDETSQDGYIAERILEHYEEGVSLQNQAVLFRAAHHSDSLEVELTRRNVPYHKYGGLRFLESAHVKDLVALLRIAENPRDEMAWFRILQLLDGIGPSHAARAMEHLAAHRHKPGSLESFNPPPAAKTSLRSLVSALVDIESSGLSPGTQVERLRQFYTPILSENYDNPVVRSRDLENLENVACGYASRGKFLLDLQLDPPSSTSDLAGPPSRDEDWVVLSTIHSAKGCEWDVVYLIHAADGCLPSDMATGSQEEIEEERRLAYVAMTRAKDFLYVTWPFRYYHRWQKYGDGHSYAQLSRFLSPDVRQCFQEVNLAESEAEESTSDLAPGDGIHQSLLAMWD